MTKPRITDERLRSWLDGDQPGRERLCLQVLALDRRFSAVQPRQPKGGPDGGYDLEAIFQATRRAIGAIGFRNAPSDNAADRAWVKRKFQADLAAARANAGDFDIFVFFTNVLLTVNGKQSLRHHAKESARVTAEIFDRENLRITLDAPEGLAARYQYLQLPMDEAEQASFFARWGSDIQSLMTSSFEAVDDRLRRLEFLHDLAQPLKNLAFTIALRERVHVESLPHVRAVLSIAKITRTERRSQWHVGICDNNPPLRALPNCGSIGCLGTAFWLGDPKKTYMTTAATRAADIEAIHARGGFSSLSDPRVVAKLQDVDDSFFALFMNRKLFGYLKSISIYANAYLLWRASADELAGSAPNGPVRTPWQFSVDELDDPWVRVMPRGFTGSLHFSETTPLRLWTPSSVVDRES